jgi:hypothetical protein
MNFKKLIFFLFLFTNFFIKSAELQFINNTDDTIYVKFVGWKRFYGLIYRQEDARAVGKLQTLNWYPTIKSNIERNLLEIYDKNKKLVYKLNIKPYKGVSVSAGFTRVIVYSGVDFYEDIIEQSGKKLSHIMRVGEDFIGQSREFINMTRKPRGF